MGIGLFIIGMGLFLLKDVFFKQMEVPSLWLLILIFLTIVARYICSNYIMKKGLEINSNILISNAKESKMDVLSSFFLLLIVILSQFSYVIPCLKYVDIIGGILISILIIFVGFQIIKKEVNELIGMQDENNDLIKDIGDILLGNGLVKDFENISLLKFGRSYLAIFKIYFNKDLKVSVASGECKKLEKQIMEKYDMINTVILKVDYLEDDEYARATRSRNSKKKFRK